MLYEILMSTKYETVKINDMTRTHPILGHVYRLQYACSPLRFQTWHSADGYGATCWYVYVRYRIRIITVFWYLTWYKLMSEHLFLCENAHLLSRIFFFKHLNLYHPVIYTALSLGFRQKSYVKPFLLCLILGISYQAVVQYILLPRFHSSTALYDLIADCIIYLLFQPATKLSHNGDQVVGTGKSSGRRRVLKYILSAANNNVLTYGDSARKRVVDSIFDHICSMIWILETPLRNRHVHLCRWDPLVVTCAIML